MKRIWQSILGFLLVGAIAMPAQAGFRRDVLRSSLDTQVYEAGDFRIEFRNEHKAQVVVTHVDEPSRVLWSTIPGKSFLRTAQSSFHVEEHRGSFNIDEYNYRNLKNQKVEAIYQEYDQVVILGTLKDRWRWNRAQFAMVFHESENGHLQFQVDVWDGSCWFWFCEDSFNQTRLVYTSEPDEDFLGFGEQFTYDNLKGHRVGILAQEGGVSRGRQPFAAILNLLSEGSAGDDYTSYAPVPHYLTTKNRSLFLENTEYSVFDMRNPHEVEVRVQSPTMVGRILYGTGPLDLIEKYTSYSGRMKVLPDWIGSGAIVGMQGGTDRLYEVWEQLQEYNTPIAAFWIQDWVGKRKTVIGSQLWWNWELDNDHYAGWDEMRSDLEDADIRLMGYINSFLVDPDGFKPWTRNLFQEALNDELVIYKDNGEPYFITNTDFDAAMLDLTNPATQSWLKGVIQDEMIEAGFSGWMADFCEALPFDAVLHSGISGATYHNQYPVDWAKLNSEAIAEAGREGDIVFFNRAGFTRSPAYSTLFWEGDQMVTWDKQDGLKSAITGLVTGGISGISLNHSDIGGYTSIEKFGFGIKREEDLLLRWMEANAFTAAFRTHEGNQPEANAQFYDNDTTLSHFAKFATVFALLASYRKELMQDAQNKGYPLVRHMYLEYPEDPKSLRAPYQWMLGEDLLVAPIVEKYTSSRDVYLPAGSWVHLWTGEAVESSGMTMRVHAPVGEPPVFFKAGAQVGADLTEGLGL